MHVALEPRRPGASMMHVRLPRTGHALSQTQGAEVPYQCGAWPCPGQRRGAVGGMQALSISVCPVSEAYTKTFSDTLGYAGSFWGV